MSKTDSQLVNSTLNISIPTFTDKTVDKKNVTFYNVEIYNNFSKQRWSLEKRYNEFNELRDKMVKLLPNLPTLPGKTMFKVTSYDGLTKRKQQLEQFLQSCVQRKDVMTNQAFKDFLEMDKFSPELSAFDPEKIAEYVDLPLGVRDFIYLKYEGICYLACSDMNIASRMDAYITNVNFPWEKKTDAHISVGAVFAYKVTNDSNNAFYFEKLWAKSFPKQTGVLSWEPESYTLAVGLDDGKIFFYKVNSESNFLQFDELCELKPHTNRVMGISFDSKSGYIYSCSSDKKFVVSEINYQESVTEVTTGSHGFTNLVSDKKNERLFLTNEVGVVFVYSVSTFPPTLLTSVQTSSKTSIRGLYIDYKKFYIFTATITGRISVLDLGQPGKERFIKEITGFGGNLKLRVLRYNSSANELISGDDSGKITIWSLRRGQPICNHQFYSRCL
jgi:WD40 repeat protein